MEIPYNKINSFKSLSNDDTCCVTVSYGATQKQVFCGETCGIKNIIGFGGVRFIVNTCINKSIVYQIKTQDNWTYIFTTNDVEGLETLLQHKTNKTVEL